jgi:hypothetical protein
MNRNIDISGEKRSLDFCSKQSFATSLTLEQPAFIALRCDDSDLDSRVRSRRLNRFFNQTGLRACQLAAACTQDDVPSHRRNLTRDSLQGKLLALLQL